MKQTRKSIDDLNLLDDFLFYEVVSGKKGDDFCRLLIKAVCDRDVGSIRIRPQKTIQGIDIGKHGIRMDLYVDDDGKCMYDIEPDKYTSRDALPRRNRYYRALLDGTLLDAGENFEQIPELWTIFILPHDPFGRNRMCYTVRNNIIEEPDIEYKDGVVSLFLYTKGISAGNEALSQLLHYMEHSVEENAVTEELQALHNYVTAIKQRKEVGVRYMKSWELEQMWRKEAREEGLAEGREIGREMGCKMGREEGLLKGKIQSILYLLSDIGDVPESIKEKISNETNPETLVKWLKQAANADSISGFEKNMLQ